MTVGGYFVNSQDMARINNALLGYFEKKHSLADAVAAEWVSLPEYLQIPLYELCIAYLERLAKEEYLSEPDMQTYRDVARMMIEAIQY